MSTMERQPVSNDVNLDCPGCVERDLEIERLLELNRSLNSRRLSVKTSFFLVAGWLAMTFATFALIVFCIDASKAGASWVMYVSIGVFESIFVVQFGLVPSLLVIHGGRPRYRILAGCVATLGMLLAWALAASVQADLKDIWEELSVSVCALPVAVTLSMLPMFLMKLYGRWTLVSPGEEGRTSAPSISSILAMTALVAGGVACLTELDISEFLGTGSASEVSFLFCYFLATPSLAVGAMLSVCCFCVLGERRWIIRSVVGFAVVTILFSVVLPACLSGFAIWALENETVDQDFLQWMFLHSLGPMFVGMLVGLGTACWLRLAGYRLCTRSGSKLGPES